MLFQSGAERLSNSTKSLLVNRWQSSDSNPSDFKSSSSVTLDCLIVPPWETLNKWWSRIIPVLVLKPWLFQPWIELWPRTGSDLIFVAIKAMATHSSTLAWKIPGMEGPGRLPSMGMHRVGHDWSDLAVAAATFLPLLLNLYFTCSDVLYIYQPSWPLCSVSQSCSVKAFQICLVGDHPACPQWWGASGVLCSVSHSAPSGTRN